MIIHNNLLECAESTQIFFIHRKWATVLIVVLTADIKLFGKDIIFKLGRWYRNLQQKRTKELSYELYKLEEKQNHT